LDEARLEADRLAEELAMHRAESKLQQTEIVELKKKLEMLVDNKKDLEMKLQDALSRVDSSAEVLRADLRRVREIWMEKYGDG
jgi:septal ring factor EnvC (AmiA/AmiB activator)